MLAINPALDRRTISEALGVALQCQSLAVQKLLMPRMGVIKGERLNVLALNAVGVGNAEGLQLLLASAPDGWIDYDYFMDIIPYDEANREAVGILLSKFRFPPERLANYFISRPPEVRQDLLRLIRMIHMDSHVSQEFPRACAIRTLSFHRNDALETLLVEEFLPTSSSHRDIIDVGFKARNADGLDLLLRYVPVDLDLLDEYCGRAQEIGHGELIEIFCNQIPDVKEPASD